MIKGKDIMTGRELQHATGLFDDNVKPAIYKLKLLYSACENGLFGQEGGFDEEEYHNISQGLWFFLEDIIVALDRYGKDLYALHHLERERMMRGEIVDPQGYLGPGKERNLSPKELKILGKRGLA